MPTHQRMCSRVIDVVLWTLSSEPCVKSLQFHRPALELGWFLHVLPVFGRKTPQSFLQFRTELNVERRIEIKR
jgi:hypothetical protein